ncbi:flagella basal body P-ring formation protein FlgA [Malonomonas rubra DSM 5091]|uniref:Flagella basal body P-ring formation protein FlgA n=1 Tax=Malonomonas rubra DSM 5091 TaxID=1122189 RepID=A0A1M6MB29_MALRU|nr:flagellar basal body P-ring formation chaperone FlgA [Malonomonas rubra]SHJ80669.1 flagella basal body P-ring formation protein FlgA [Malonomonas rubra DSM 5091]
MKKMLLIIVLAVLPFVAMAQSPEEKGVEISQQEMAEVLSDFLTDASERLPGVELRFTAMRLPQPFTVPTGHLDFQVIPAKPGVIGSRRVTLMTRVDDRVVSNRSIRVEIEALAEILVAADNLRRGEILDKTNAIFQQQNIAKLKQPLFIADEVLGKRLKRSVRLGQPILRKQVEFPPLVNRGDRVVIRVERGSLLLTAAGEAKQDGVLDETIRVLNVNTHKEIRCRVLGPGLVTVEY